jgi:hypothetical protein
VSESALVALLEQPFVLGLAHYADWGSRSRSGVKPLLRFHGHHCWSPTVAIVFPTVVSRLLRFEGTSRLQGFFLHSCAAKASPLAGQRLPTLIDL